jgi:hypothetical protein
VSGLDRKRRKKKKPKKPTCCLNVANYNYEIWLVLDCGEDRKGSLFNIKYSADEILGSYHLKRATI